MKLTFTRPYISINSLDEIDIADFCVITGLNGSGKTHLLKAINDGAITVSNIDPSEIVYYNYSDFIIHNGDPSADQQLQQKSMGYNNKTNLFNQRVFTERNTILNAFTLVLQVGNTQFGTESFHHIANFDELSNWSDDDFNYYNIIVEDFQNTDNTDAYFYKLRPHQISFLQAIGISQSIHDIKSSISSIKQFKRKVDAFHWIRNSSFSKNLLNWNPEEISSLPGLGNDIFENIRNNELRANLSPGLSFFIDILAGSPNPIPNLDEERFRNIRSAIEAMFEEIEKYFIQQIRPSTLSIIKGINGAERILEHFTIESGFLNLYEIIVAEKQYQVQKNANEYAGFVQSKGKPVHYLSDQEFLSTFGDSPVDTLNKVLIEYDCNGYEFQQSELQYSWGMDISQQQIQIRLYNKKGNYYTTLDSLSSGERTLLALSFTVFKLRQRKVIAKLFLLDEIDSALHPSMSKKLLNVLHDLFHKELGINILISTHSPSTIAFAPEKGIYVMKREGKPKLAQTNRDRALSELTTGVPSFSINYENRRQVFVESQYDAQFYESLYNIYKNHLDPEISLNFIPSGNISTNSNGVGISSCEQVKKITSILREAGNKFIWGIIDWDLNTVKPQDVFVKVLGYESRYSMENYLLDPLLIAILLLREKFVEPSFFGFDNNIKIFNVLTFEVTLLQKMIDVIISKLTGSTMTNSETAISYQLINGGELSIPEWFCKYNGHKLEERYLQAFPRLNEIKRNREAALKQSVIEKVIADFPGLTPMDLLDVLRQVQEI